MVAGIVIQGVQYVECKVQKGKWLEIGCKIGKWANL